MIDSMGSQISELLLWVVNLFWGPANLFKHPGYLWLLLIPLGYLFWYVWWYSPRRLIVPLSYDPEKLAPTKIQWGFLRVVPHVLNMLALTFMALALARPITRNERQNRFTNGIDIMLILDTSGSMETDDFSPNRLEVAKDKAIEFINGRQGDNIGIVLFAEDAFGYVPLTFDYDLLRTSIRDVDSDIMPKTGTAMGSAILVGLNKILSRESPSKVMILLTDGASNRGEVEPITAAQLARDKEVKIYSIGIGKEEYTKAGMFGLPQTFKSDLDEGTLKEISKITGGQFFRATNERGLKSIFAQISEMEKVEIKGSVTREEKDHYQGLLVFAGILMALGMVVSLTFVYNPLEG